MTLNRIMTIWSFTTVTCMNTARKKGPRKPTTGQRDSARSGSTHPGPGSGFEKVFEKIYRLVLRIPRGRVMTYGQIARLLEERYSPRLVGWAMHATPKDGRNIPWHRVVDSQGSISTGRLTIQEPDLQRLMLEAEDVVFNERGRCDLSVYQWSPRINVARIRRKSLRTKPRKVRAETGTKLNGNKKTRKTTSKK